MTTQPSSKMTNPVTIDQYIELRLDAQQAYHSKKAGEFQDKYTLLSRTQIILAALIPVIAIIDPTKHTYIQLVTGIVGAIIAIVGGFMSLGNYQQNWIAFRTTSEALKAERVRFVTRCGEYSNSAIVIASDVINKDEAEEHILLCRLQNNVEKIIANQNDQWQQRREQTIARDKKNTSEPT